MLNEQGELLTAKQVKRQYDEPLDFYEDIANEVEIVLDPLRARKILADLHGIADVALDFETTSLSPKIGEVRLSCLFHPEFGPVVLDHFFCGTFKELSASMLGCEWLVYNAKFEMRWFDHEHPGKVSLLDVDYMAKSKLGGYPSSLKRMAKRDLGVDMDKTLQVSGWSQPALSKAQYAYGALDAVLTWFIADYWWSELDDDQADAIDVFNDSVRGTVECEETGLILDAAYHETIVRVWRMKQENALRALRRIVPSTALDNVNSNKQVSDFLKSQLDDQSILAWPLAGTGKRGYLSLERKTIAPIAARSPYPFSRFLNAFMLYRYYSKYLSTYGDTLLNKQQLAGRITSRFNIAQAATGRYSSSDSNLQNIPRKIYVRKGFVAPPGGGRRLVLADYSGIEVRVLAEASGDEQLKQDSIYGDVHSGSAGAIYHIDPEEIRAVVKAEDHSALYYRYKEMRTRAKGFTFQLTYGAAAPALSLVLKCSVDEAEDAIAKWAARYPKAYGFRQTIFDQMHYDGFIPVCDGRTIYIRKPDRTMPVAANYPIQGAAASVMYRAVYHVHRMKEAAGLGQQIKLAASVHDELLLYAWNEHAEQAHEILRNGMERAWLDIFPNTDTHNLIESVIGDTWAAKP